MLLLLYVLEMAAGYLHSFSLYEAISNLKSYSFQLLHNLCKSEREQEYYGNTKSHIVSKANLLSLVHYQSLELQH